jgi:hypothetical protein
MKKFCTLFESRAELVLQPVHHSSLTLTVCSRQILRLLMCNTPRYRYPTVKTYFHFIFFYLS